jgi:hypothetical protein
MNVIQKIANITQSHPLVIVVVFLLTVVSSSIGIWQVVTENEKLKHQAKFLMSPSDIKKVVSDTAREVTEHYNTYNIDSAYLVKSDVKQKNDALTVSFYFEHKVNFPEGDYLPEKAIHNQQFIQAAALFAASLEKVYKGTVVPSTVVFEGSSDTILGDKKVGVYQGRFDEIDENVVINGVKTRIHLKPNSVYTNAELAVLRAISVYTTFKSQLQKYGVNLAQSNIEFIANEHKKYGIENRYGKVIFKINTSEF